MKILFIQPPYPFSEFPKPSYALMSMGAVLKEQGMDVEVLDLLSTRYSRKKIEDRLARYRPDLIGMTSVTMNFPGAVGILQTCKTLMPEATTVIGGPHATFMAEETLPSFPEVDIVVRGEGEETILELAQALDRRRRPEEDQGADFPPQRIRRLDGRPAFHPRYRPAAASRSNSFPHLPLPGHAGSGQRAHEPRLSDGMFVLRGLPHDRPQGAVPQSPAGGGRNRGGAASRVRRGVHRRRSLHPQPAACDRDLRRDPEPRAEAEALHLRPGRHGRRAPSPQTKGGRLRHDLFRPRKRKSGDSGPGQQARHRGARPPGRGTLQGRRHLPLRVLHPRPPGRNPGNHGGDRLLRPEPRDPPRVPSALPFPGNARSAKRPRNTGSRF